MINHIFTIIKIANSTFLLLLSCLQVYLYMSILASTNSKQICILDFLDAFFSVYIAFLISAKSHPTVAKENVRFLAKQD